MATAKKAQVIITANASVAQKVMDELQKNAQRAASEMKRLADAGKGNTAEFKKAEKEFQAFNSAIRENVKDTKRVEEVMKNLSGTATRDLRRALQAAKRELDKLSAKDPKRDRLVNDMKKIQAQIDANTGALKRQGSTLNTTLKNLVSYAGVFAGFNKIKSLIEGVFQSNLKLSDSLADIRKVSGLAMTDINRLYRNISQIDTRNTIETLNQLAYTGAKLGIGQNYGVEGLTGFVKAAEQVQMALGEDMGEKALPELAKMTEVMGLIDKYGVEQAMQKAASAIFQLGATSTATGTNIVEFSKRLYGLANVTRISTDDLLALGSAADAMGLMPEVAATAFNKLFTSVQKNHNMIEKTLGLQQGLIKSYYDQGRTMEAIVAIFEKMNQTGNLNLLGGVFKDLGSDGARLVNVMATMADRVDILRKHLETSRTAFKEGEAVIGEYMIQNQTAAAMVERASNLWAKAFTNPEGVTMVQTLAKEWYDLSKEMTSSQSTMLSLKSTIDGVALALRTIISLAPFLIKAFAWGGILAMIRGIGFGLYGLITQLRAATGAAMTLQVALKSNWVLAGVSAVAAAMTMLYEKSQAAAQAAEAARERQAELDKAFASSKEAVKNVVKPLETYKRVLDEANLSEKQKMDLVKDFNSTYSEYLDFLGIEVKSVDDLRDAYARVVEVMRIKKAYEERESYRTQVNGTNRMDRIGAQAQAESEARSLGVEGINKEYLEGTQNIHRNGYVVRQGSNEVVLDILRKRYGNNVGMSASGQVYRIETIDKSQPVSANNQRVVNIDVDVSGLRSAVSKYISSYRTEKQTDQEVDQRFDSEFSWTDGTGKKRSLSDFNIDEYNQKVMEGRYKRKGSLDREAPDKEAARAARKAQQEEKQALRKELQDAKQESDAIISKIEEWYRLQETTITAFAADGKWTQQQADVMIDQLNQAKNQALADARHSISGRDTESWEQTKQQIGTLMFDTSDQSQHLLQEILDVRLENVRRALSHIDKTGNQYGITSGSLRDSINKNAAGNLREVERIQKKSANEIEKMLKQYDFFQQAVDAFNNRLTQLGLLTESAAAAARRIQQAAAAEGTPEALRPDYRTAEQQEADYQRRRSEGMAAAASRFIAGGGKSMAVNYNDTAELDRWLRELTGAEGTIGSNGFEFQFDSWADAFREDFDKWLHDSGKYKSEIQAFYLSLVQASDDYTEATRKAYEREKKLQDQRFEVAGYRDEEERTDTALQRDQQMKDAGVGTSLAEQLGLDRIADDPEILRIQNRIHWRNLEYEDAKRNLEAQMELDRLRIEDMQRNGATEQQIEQAKIQLTQQRAGLEQLMQERQTELINETYNLTTQVAQQMQKRVDSIKNFVKPVTDFTQAAGRKIGDMIFNMESEEATWEELWKNMALAVGESVIQMGAQYMENFIMQQSINRASESEEMAHAAAEVPAGIASGAAKTIGELGWWGIPLVAVISALLMGLLQSALSTKRGNGSEAKTTKTNVKLKSGMLTYDEGTGIPGYGSRRSIGSGSQWRGQNGEYISGSPRSVSGGSSAASSPAPVLGDDGRFYRATPQPSLPEGVSIVRKPIATTVNGQQALVAERGPEIVIGRKTTRRLMMNEPGLLRALATADRGITTRRLRTFDEGNIADLAQAVGSVNGGTSAVPAPEGSSDSQQQDQMAQTLSTLAQTVATLSQTVAALQRDGIQARVAKYGSGSLDEGMREISAFRKRYPG